ncbi:MAG: elongation factor P maturation arginine rhamnosyltransferase EarP [Ideonella sp.]|nr:elongation factor P maturation arginine rhamnosyltransferase EarP [Ideonella sp.]
MWWDLFCRVIDNHGDLGVCWRLAADLAARGQMVRLWVDDARALAWMAPQGAANVTLQAWPDDRDELTGLTPGDVVIEAFGCELPRHFIAAMARRPRHPLWINLEYLSAEPYVEASHRLRSPQFSGPGTGLDKWFFYPGFTAGTGGLLRETGLHVHQTHFDRQAWLAQHGWAPRPGEQLVSLFCYDNPALPDLLAQLARHPTLLLACPGPAQRQLDALVWAGPVRRIDLPWLPQPDYDRLLWSCDLNFVRGEDSFVRAMWAGQPFVWQIYPQDDGAHAAKLDAFLATFLAPSDPRGPWSGAPAWMAMHRAWNGLAAWPPSVPAHAQWAERCRRWRSHLMSQVDLVTQLQRFVAETR